MLKESAVEALNSQLTAIFQKESFFLHLDDLNDDKNVSENLSIIFGALVARSHDLDGRVTLLQPNLAFTVTDIFKSVADLKPHFEASATLLKYRLVSLLCSHLQAERIAKLVITGPARRNYAADRSKVVFQLDKICRNLQINLDGVENEKEIMDLVISHLTECLKDTRTRSILQNSPKILKNFTGEFVLNFPEQHKHIVDQIVITLFQMLLQRLDVTIRSFLWGEKGQGKEGEIVAAIMAQRDHLSEMPFKYTMIDALAAPISLLHESSKRVTDLGSRKGSIVKSVLIGAVPDRGGRSNEIRPKPLSSGGGGGGERGRGRGGRGRYNNSGRNKSGGGRDSGEGREGKGDGGRQGNKRSKRDEADKNADQQQEETKK